MLAILTGTALGGMLASIIDVRPIIAATGAASLLAALAAWTGLRAAAFEKPPADAGVALET